MKGHRHTRKCNHRRGATKSHKGKRAGKKCAKKTCAKKRGHKRGHSRGGFAAQLHKALVPFGLFAAQKGYSRSRTRKAKGGKHRRGCK